MKRLLYAVGPVAGIVGGSGVLFMVVHLYGLRVLALFLVLWAGIWVGGLSCLIVWESIKKRWNEYPGRVTRVGQDKL